MKAKYTCITAQGGRFCIDGDTCEPCDDIIGRCEQVHDVEIEDIVNEEVLGGISMDDVLAEIADEGPEIDDELLAEVDDGGIVEEEMDIVEETMMLHEVISVPDGTPANEACFE